MTILEFFGDLPIWDSEWMLNSLYLSACSFFIIRWTVEIIWVHSLAIFWDDLILFGTQVSKIILASATNSFELLMVPRSLALLSSQNSL